MARDPFNQEPDDGDFVAYIDNLQKGKIRTGVGGPSAVVYRKSDGGLAVETAQRMAAAREEKIAVTRQNALFTIEKAFLVVGCLLVAVGLFCFIEAVTAPQDTGALPVAGMVMMFVGIVLTSQISQNIKRRNRKARSS